MNLEKDEYLTISREGKGLYKEKGSKFIAVVFHVRSEEEVKSHLLSLRKEYHDARHHSYAYRIDPANSRHRINDDGEPSGTAGKPIFGQIQSFELTDILVVVIRYFGGTKLGVSGLIKAYKTASREALSNSVIIKKTINNEITFKFEYSVLNQVMRIIKELEPRITEQLFDLECNMRLRIRETMTNQLVSRLSKIKSVEIIRQE